MAVVAAHGDGMKEQSWHRRHAIRLAAQLPDEREDALLVLQAATQLVVLPGFWGGPTQADKPAATVVLIGGNDCA